MTLPDLAWSAFAGSQLVDSWRGGLHWNWSPRTQALRDIAERHLGVEPEALELPREIRREAKEWADAFQRDDEDA